MKLEDKEKVFVHWQKLKIEAQQKEMEQLKGDLAIHKGISDGKSIIIKQLEAQLKK